MNDEISSKIIEVLQPLCPDVDLSHSSSAYHTSCIDEIVKIFKNLNDYPLALSYPESIRVNILNNVVAQIETDLIEERHNYLRRNDQPKDDYEIGVLNAIRLIQHRVHCICD